MQFIFNLSVLIGCLFASGSLIAKQWVKTYALEAYIGPEIYYIYRTRGKETKQSGTLYGVRLGYDHIQRHKLYWGIDALWAQGILEGKTGKEKETIKSLFTDSNIEARVGFTFQSKFWRCASLTLYLGGGYFWEYNFYQHPSRLQVHFKNRFSYLPFGFLSQIFITSRWSIGANFKVRYLFESSVHVSHDPENDRATQNYEERLQYRAELPVTYFMCWNKHSLAVSLIPFYEYRPYGYRANFPFDFLETKLRLYGATLKLLYLF
jgi:hypothetical protein